MRRREFISLLGGAAAIPLAARAKQTMPVVGFLSSLTAKFTNNRISSFSQGLQETGLIVDRDVAITQRLADGQYDRLPALAANLVKQRVNLIAALAPPAAFAAKAETTTIPIVFVGALDPVKAGLVESLNRPGGKRDDQHHNTYCGCLHRVGRTDSNQRFVTATVVNNCPGKVPGFFFW
jgi:ABC-type uncharacterized transport system substrate-binding protein